MPLDEEAIDKELREGAKEALRKMFAEVDAVKRLYDQQNARRNKCLTKLLKQPLKEHTERQWNS